MGRINSAWQEPRGGLRVDRVDQLLAVLPCLRTSGNEGLAVIEN